MSKLDPSDGQFITAESTAMAIGWCQILESHARKIYQPITGIVQKGAAAVLADKIRTGRVMDGMRLREIARMNWANLKERKNTAYSGLAVPTRITR